MTIKYLSLLNAVFLMVEKKTGYEWIDKKFAANFHVPVDSYILEAVWDKPSVKIPLRPSTRRRAGTKYYPEKVVPWSDWKNDEEKGMYTLFQESLKKILEAGGDISPQVSPLDWENQVWIDVAQSRKNKKKGS